jgi:hypothetical protein
MNGAWGALVFLPFIVWYAYRARRAIKTGVFDSWSGPVERASQPSIFWSYVVRQILLSLLLVATAVSLFLKPAATMRLWVLAGWVVIYVTVSLFPVFRHRPRPNPPLERSGSAGRSAPSR